MTIAGIMLKKVIKMEWKTIEKYPNYSISSTGLIKNNTSGKILKQFLHKNGYWAISIAPNGRQGKKVMY